MKSRLYYMFKKEIREVFRDKKSLMMMLIIPLFIPLIVIGMSAMFDMETNKEVTEYNKIGFAYELDEVQQSLAESMDLEITLDTEEKLKEKLSNNEIYLYITKENNNYIINSKTSENSSYATKLAENYLSMYKRYLQEQYLVSNEINPDEVVNIINIDYNVTEEDNFFVSYMQNYAFLFIIMAITVSATYPATDATAGEKERGTLETLLTFPVKSKDIILGKFLSVSFSSVVTGLISLVLAIISLGVVQNMFSIYDGINVMYNIPTIILSIFIILSYSIFISGLCIAIASKSKSFKEAQSALTPLTFISFFPGMIAFVAGISTTPLIAVIPFLNYTQIFTDLVNGNFEILNIALMFISSIIYILLVLIVIIKQYKSEKVLF